MTTPAESDVLAAGIDAPWQRPGHFRAGEPLILGGGDSWYPLTVEADDRANGGQYLPGAAEQYRHRGRRCVSCADDVAQQQTVAAAEDRGYRATFSATARELADRLCGHALVLVRGAGCATEYRLNPRAPLPTWLHAALTAAVFSGPDSEGGWPNFGRTASPVDWPALIVAHPEWLVPDHQSLKENGGARWPGIAAAYSLLSERGYSPRLDVALWVEQDGRISVEPISLIADPDRARSAGLVEEVDDVLVSAGRLRDELRFPTNPGPDDLDWMLNG